MGRKPIFDRNEQRKNQVVVPMSELEKQRVQDAAIAEDRSVASFVRMVLNAHFKKEAESLFTPEFVCGILATIGVEILLLIGYAIFRKK